MLAHPVTGVVNAVALDHVMKSFDLSFMVCTPQITYNPSEVIVTATESFKGFANMHLRIVVTFDRTCIDPTKPERTIGNTCYTVNDLRKMFGEEAITKIEVGYQLFSALQEKLLSIGCVVPIVGNFEQKDDFSARQALVTFLSIVGENDQKLPGRWKFLNFGGFSMRDVKDLRSWTDAPLQYTNGSTESVFSPPQRIDEFDEMAKNNRTRFHGLLGYVSVLRSMGAIPL